MLVQSLDQENPWRREWQPPPVFLPGESHGWRSLVGYSPWGREESDTTEWLHFHSLLPCVAVGNGDTLQCSCLENPREGGAWWAAIYGVTQSLTRLMWLSSSIGATKCFFCSSERRSNGQTLLSEDRQAVCIRASGTTLPLRREAQSRCSIWAWPYLSWLLSGQEPTCQ